MSDDIRNRPGLKRREIEPCLGCGKGVMHSNQIAFYRVRLERFVCNLPAIQRAHGLEVMMGGNVGIAMALSPDEDLAKQLHGHTFLLCDDCAIMRAENIAVYDEAAAEREKKSG